MPRIVVPVQTWLHCAEQSVMQARVEKLEQLLAVSITEKDAALAERDAAVNAKNAVCWILYF